MTFLGVIFGQIGTAFAVRNPARVAALGRGVQQPLPSVGDRGRARDRRRVRVRPTVSSTTNGHLVFARFIAARGKSDSFDSFVLAELARTRRHRFRVLAPDSDRTKSRRCRPATRFCTTSSRPPRLLRRLARPQPPLRARSGTARRAVRSEVPRQRRRSAPAATLAAHAWPGGTAALAVAGLRSSNARRYKAGPARLEVNVFGVAAANRFAP